MKLAGDELKQSLLHALQQSLTGFDSICIALSGGLDSTVLLHLCDLLRAGQPQLKLSAFHVHHGLSPHADEWLAHCKTVTSTKNIEFGYYCAGIEKQAQQSLEAQARNARYNALSQYAGQEKLVLLAQHEDDQAETFLLQLKRGAGTKGLSSMPKFYIDARGTRYLRPLLQFSREALALFASNENLSWIEDESNQDQRFDRNFLRQSILPQLHERWPQFNTTVARSAMHCSNAQSVINEYMQLIQNKVLLTKDRLSVAELTLLSNETQAEFVRFWLSQFLPLSPSFLQVDTLLRMAQSESTQASHLMVQDVCIEYTQGCLLVSKLPNKQFEADNKFSNQESAATLFSWQGQSEQTIAHHLKIKTIDELSATNNPQAFFLPFGDYKVDYGKMSLRAKMHEKRPSKALKTWFQEWSVSPLRRQYLPILIQILDDEQNNENVEKVVAIYRTDLLTSIDEGDKPQQSKKGQGTKQLSRIACEFTSSNYDLGNCDQSGAWVTFLKI